jgi:hypothetical protein
VAEWRSAPELKMNQDVDRDTLRSSASKLLMPELRFRTLHIGRRHKGFFLALCSIPLLLSVVIPAGLNLIFAFRESLRPVNIFMTKIAFLLSVVLSIIGSLLIMKAARARDLNNVIVFGVSTLVASIPAAIIICYFVVFVIL